MGSRNKSGKPDKMPEGGGGGQGGGEESWGVAGVGWTDILSRGYVGSNTPSCFI